MALPSVSDVKGYKQNVQPAQPPPAIEKPTDASYSVFFKVLQTTQQLRLSPAARSSLINKELEQLTQSHPKALSAFYENIAATFKCSDEKPAARLAFAKENVGRMPYGDLFDRQVFFVAPKP